MIDTSSSRPTRSRYHCYRMYCAAQDIKAAVGLTRELLKMYNITMNAGLRWISYFLCSFKGYFLLPTTYLTHKVRDMPHHNCLCATRPRSLPTYLRRRKITCMKQGRQGSSPNTDAAAALFFSLQQESASHPVKVLPRLVMHLLETVLYSKTLDEKSTCLGMYAIPSM